MQKTGPNVLYHRGRPYAAANPSPGAHREEPPRLPDEVRQGHSPNLAGFCKRDVARCGSRTCILRSAQAHRGESKAGPTAAACRSPWPRADVRFALRMRLPGRCLATRSVRTQQFKQQIAKLSASMGLTTALFGRDVCPRLYGARLSAPTVSGRGPGLCGQSAEPFAVQHCGPGASTVIFTSPQRMHRKTCSSGCGPIFEADLRGGLRRPGRGQAPRGLSASRGVLLGPSLG
jgi:hypothetical protein